jgi:glutamate dehydrogenase (NAD(P)+)
MAWVMDTYSMHVGHTETAVVTGKPVEMGGSLGRREATGRGVMVVTREAAAHLGLPLAGLRIAIQGFGNVGSVSADLLARAGARIVAVTDIEGGVHNAAGLDIPALLQWTAARRTVAGFLGADRLDPAELFGLDVDVLIPAAMENQITMANVDAIRARIVVEAANGPTDPAAQHRLRARGTFVVPDILANAGGVTASYFEWVQDRHGYFWTETEVVTRLEDKMREAFATVLRTALGQQVDLRTAAYMVAISRVADVTRLRGMYA